MSGEETKVEKTEEASTGIRHMDMAQLKIAQMKNDYLINLTMKALSDIETAEQMLFIARERLEEITELTINDVCVVNDFGNLNVGLRQDFNKAHDVRPTPKRIADLPMEDKKSPTRF